MGKKVKEYKSGDFIFAKVKGYPAWPARVQRANGKKYFVYFYGTGETANLPPNMIFDYAENKDKFLTKPVKRRDFNDGVKQIEYDFAHNVPLEQVIGISLAIPEDASANNTLNDTAANDTVDDSMAVDTSVDETINEENTTQKEGAVEDSDDTAALVIDEGKAKGRKSAVKTPAKDTPKAQPKTPRGRAKKEEADEAKELEKKEEEIVSRSGRKIRPKRYADEQIDENATLPSPVAKKRRGASPPPVEKDKEKEKDKDTKDKSDKNIKFNTVPQSNIEDLKEPFVPGDGERDNILIVYLPSGQYVGIKLFQSRPSSFKNDAAKLQWDRQSAAHAIKLKQQLERGQITAQSVLGQLVMDLNLTDEEKATLDKERETEEKKSRVQFLKTEMKLIELDARIKTCLCLEKADTELCLKLLDELMELDIKPLMLLKHPSCLETVKRMRAYVGNTPSWDLKEEEVLVFSQHAHRIRKQTDVMYSRMKDLFTIPEGLTFWEFFMERVSQFKAATSKLSSDELLELVHEPLEMTMPTSHTMRASIDAVNDDEPMEDEAQKKKTAPAKSKKPVNSTPAKAPVKRQNSRKQEENKKQEDKKEDKNSKEKDSSEEKASEVNNKAEESSEELKDKESESKDEEAPIDKDTEKQNADDKVNNSEKSESTEDSDKIEKAQEPKKDEKKLQESKKDDKKTQDSKKDDKKSQDSKKEEKKTQDKKEEKKSQDKKEENDTDKKDSKESSKDKLSDKKDSKESSKEKTGDKKDSKESSKEKEETTESSEQSDKEDKGKDKEKDKNDDEPKAKRLRESKKTEPPPPRSPTKRKSKA